MRSGNPVPDPGSKLREGYPARPGNQVAIRESVHKVWTMQWVEVRAGERPGRADSHGFEVDSDTFGQRSSDRWTTLSSPKITNAAPSGERSYNTSTWDFQGFSALANSLLEVQSR